MENIDLFLLFQKRHDAVGTLGALYHAIVQRSHVPFGSGPCSRTVLNKSCGNTRLFGYNQENDFLVKSLGEAG